MGCKTFFMVVGAVVGIGAVVTVLVLFIPSTGLFRGEFKKRCENFPQKNHSCESILGTFEEAYVGKDAWDFPEENYHQVLDQNPFTHSCNMTMFWSDTKSWVHKFTEKRDCFITLEDTLLGSVLDGQTWCGLKGSKETFFVLCMLYGNSTVKSFWNAASARFAEHACGEVTVMLDGDINQPYDPDSVFASVEVPNLQFPRVTNLTAVLLTKSENTKACEHESLRTLQSDLSVKKIGYTCTQVTRSHIKKCIEENNTCGNCWLLS